MERSDIDSTGSVKELCLSELRAEIDGVDAEIIELFLRRMELSGKISEIKKSTGAAVLDKEREAEVIRRATENVPREMAGYCEELTLELMRLSKKYQRSMRSSDIKE